MRTKILLGMAALAASALTVVAQNNVYSLNVVGYVNVPIAAGAPTSFTAIGNPLRASPDNTVQSVIGTPPHNISILTWNGTSFDENFFDTTFGWDTPTADLSPGTGFFVKNTGTAFNITFVGEVLAGPQTNTMTALFNFVSSKVPIAGDLTLDTHLNFTNVVAGDSLLTWNGTSYDENRLDPVFGWDAPPVVTVPQAFFYKEPGPTVHTVPWVTIGFP